MTATVYLSGLFIASKIRFMRQLPEMEIQVNGKLRGTALTGGSLDSRTFQGILHATPDKGLKSFTINLVLTNKKDRHKTRQLAFPVQLTSHPKEFTDG
jgi:hypothetical protein